MFTNDLLFISLAAAAAAFSMMLSKLFAAFYLVTTQTTNYVEESLMKLSCVLPKASTFSRTFL